MVFNPAGALLLALCAFFAAGCQLGDRLVFSPLNHQELERELMDIAPIGTPREQAVESLKAAGIAGRYGGVDESARSLYYCNTWERPDGERWLIDAALLFDDKGALYAVRRGTTQISAVPSVVEREEPAAWDTPPRTQAKRSSTASTNDRRTPFVGSDALE